VPSLHLQPNQISALCQAFTYSQIRYQPCAKPTPTAKSDISPVPSLHLQPNTCGGTAKKISNSPYRKFVVATQKERIKQATKSKTNRLASVPFADDTTEEEEQDADCVFCTGRFSEDHNGEE
jgi:hypothetical protein